MVQLLLNPCPGDDLFEVFSDGYFTGLTLQREEEGWTFVFNPDYDHRYAIMAGKKAGSLIEALNLLRSRL